MKKTVAITLDRERNLRLDLNAMSNFEDLTGESLFTIGEKMNQARNIRALLFSCLKSAKEEVTLEEVGDMIDIENFAYVSEKISALMNVSYGAGEESSEGK